MIINIEIPDSLIEEGRRIHIMAGQEQLAYMINGVWHIKTVRCDSCSECCVGCEYLKDKLCSLYTGMGRPFLCCVSTRHKKRVPECIEEYS